MGKTAAGTVVLLYDHIITLPEEYRFIWKAKSSFAKYIFLLNRYAVPPVMFMVLSGASLTRVWRERSRRIRLFDEQPPVVSDLRSRIWSKFPSFVDYTTVVFGGGRKCLR